MGTNRKAKFNRGPFVYYYVRELGEVILEKIEIQDLAPLQKVSFSYPKLQISTENQIQKKFSMGK